MDENIVTTWKDPQDFAVGLGLMGWALLQNGVVTREQCLSLIAPALQTADSMTSGFLIDAWAKSAQDIVEPIDEFRLVDKEGNEVQFPVTLSRRPGYRAI